MKLHVHVEFAWLTFGLAAGYQRNNRRFTICLPFVVICVDIERPPALIKVELVGGPHDGEKKDVWQPMLEECRKAGGCLVHNDPAKGITYYRPDLKELRAYYLKPKNAEKPQGA